MKVFGLLFAPKQNTPTISVVYSKNPAKLMPFSFVAVKFHIADV